MATAAQSNHRNVDDDAALQIRLALLELLTLGGVVPGSRADAKTSSGGGAAVAPKPKSRGSIVERAGQANDTLNERVEGFKPIVQFVQEYDANLALLRPNEQHASSSSSSLVMQQTVDTESTVALLLEAQADLMQFERDMRLVQTLNDRDVAGAGKLVEVQALRPRVRALQAQLAQRLSRQDDVERTLLTLMQRYTEQTDTLSELFIHWDGILREMEDELSRLERARR